MVKTDMNDTSCLCFLYDTILAIDRDCEIIDVSWFWKYIDQTYQNSLHISLCGTALTELIAYPWIFRTIPTRTKYITRPHSLV